ncbi:hypothetical protein H7347_01495 [Corynebacterium sp. zg-331]|uniref:hypothetical protein n=1 Tax=unclassified Corynebacterium TaxID=2624378 RepID=UPI00128BC7A8|nr:MULTISPECIES: hypothetical protein [unclassified Corynebacterium]MBC3185261.1 hypothetical protein [Corynebacterium sp. zg-331]MPV51758.1 hypothetical protein [Corynebacterium sp. zg331]
MRVALGAASGTLAVSALLFSSAGVLWGLSYPRYRGTLVEGGAVAVDTGHNQEFHSWLWLVLGAGLLASVLSIAVFVRSERSRGVAMQVWLGLLAGGGTAYAHAAGLSLARWRVPVPDPATLHPGDEVDVLATVGLGTPISFLFPAFAAMLAYWSCMVVAPRSAPGAPGGPRADAAGKPGES